MSGTHHDLCECKFCIYKPEALKTERDALLQIQRLRTALKPFSDACAYFEDVEGGNPDSDFIALGMKLTVGHLRKARKALEQGA